MAKKNKDEKKPVDAASSPRQEGRPISEERRGEDAASTETPKADVPPASQASQPSEAKAEPDWKNLYAVTLADFDNYKKRAVRDREDVYRYAESDILKDILPVVDNLALALEHAKDKDDEFVRGVKLVHDGLLKALADHGAKPMADLIGKDLDPNFHEAIATLPSDTVEEGKITNVAKVGWLLNDRLLRAAQVVVSAGKKA